MTTSPSAGLQLSPEYQARFADVLRRTYFASWPAGYLESEAGRADLREHSEGRISEFTSVLLPWVERVFPLTGMHVLEIGAGTGSSTVAIASRAQSVVAFDIAGASLEAAKERARLLGLENITQREVPPHWLANPDARRTVVAEAGSSVDAVFLVALLEHLTIPERISLLEFVWSLLRPGGILVVYETPNRLGWYDWHSFYLPFFHSLPDALAIPYSRRTPRPSFAIPEGPDQVEALYRLGRGVSYHEFDLAIGLDQLTVLADGYDAPLLALRGALADPEYDQALLALMAKHLPDIPAGFARPSLDLVILRDVDAEARARGSAASRARELQRIAAEASASRGEIEEVPLRYRLVDRLNAVVRRAPGVHPLLKRFLARAGGSRSSDP